ncbi:hypothetical protein HOP50_01g02100 [Chloropicon primus]|uniref:Uncharacterized protein n=1 Tax=Chloropicon primus TaxID=1764295 RepID=A0A5B8MEG9_9CHLO|nr:hypothetical protein A3770_01p02200 [Chloropicon primus]UPQ96919.1 hypothetical protein HOP50_01g02100 [Chloropicon primus]|eukprot:QDZ17702.1 hypothetical protein A3770_01p02200 [Chloropicon primus]
MSSTGGLEAEESERARDAGLEPCEGGSLSCGGSAGRLWHWLSGGDLGTSLARASRRARCASGWVLESPEPVEETLKDYYGSARSLERVLYREKKQSPLA